MGELYNWHVNVTLCWPTPRLGKQWNPQSFCGWSNSITTATIMWCVVTFSIEHSVKQQSIKNCFCFFLFFVAEIRNWWLNLYRHLGRYFNGPRFIWFADLVWFKQKHHYFRKQPNPIIIKTQNIDWEKQKSVRIEIRIGFSNIIKIESNREKSISWFIAVRSVKGGR